MLYLYPLKTALRCLMHPASIIAVALLLVNDHILKDAYPSFLTGKLSDVAGLFFFPFLLASFLSLLTAPLGYANTRITGSIALFTTAIWFAAAKATVAGNAMMVELVSAVRGAPVEIVLDPSDLLALMALWPTWLLWRRQEERREQRLEFRVAFPVVLLASVAAIATPATRLHTELGVTELVVADGKIYAMLGQRDAAYTTTDGGNSWIRVDEKSIPLEMGDSLRARLGRVIMGFQGTIASYNGYVSEHYSVSAANAALKDSTGSVPDAQQLLEKKLADSVAFYNHLRDSLSREENHIRSAYKGVFYSHFPLVKEDVIVVRDPAHSARMYRSVHGSTRIERSDDTGATWSPDWEISEERYTFLHRQSAENTWRPFGVNAMEFIPGSGRLAVSAGGLGLLVLDGKGEWTQHQIGEIAPLIPVAHSLDKGMSLISGVEWMAVVVLTILAGMVLSGIAWKRIPRSDDKMVEQRRPKALLRVIWFIVALLLGWLGNAASQILLGPLFHIFFLIPATLAFLIMIVSDITSLRMVAGRGALFNAVSRGFPAAFCIPALCLILWTFGIPESYKAAVILALAGWLAVVIWGIVVIRRYPYSSFHAAFRAI